MCSECARLLACGAACSSCFAKMAETRNQEMTAYEVLNSSDPEHEHIETVGDKMLHEMLDWRRLTKLVSSVPRRKTRHRAL